jgi:sigma-B regulation protein RsbU (phosphoserine phosphatase)
MAGIVFARSLTGPIDKLFKGTKVIAAGNFKTQVFVKANDEIGILADSFNFMAGRIVSLLEQEKDKVRLEEELKVAKLVQDSFFPPTHQVVGAFDVASFYTPASDCGGDWWGLVPHGKKVMLLIGDATGHGVPAALITATAASCTTTVQELGLLYPDLLDSPARVLGLLNKAVYGAAQGKILMTFFACLIDPEAKTVTYSNASHNPPYLYKHKADKEPDKKDLKPLMDAVELRLGHKQETVYQDATAEISANDVIVFFTDGFIECTNGQKEEYGSRKFIKSILKSAKSSTEEARDVIVGAAKEFYAGHPLADDLTLVVAKVLPEAQSTEGSQPAA